VTKTPVTRSCLLVLLALALPAPAIGGPITYTLRNAHFFGGTPGPTREILESGAFTPASSESNLYTFSTGGASPVVFTGTAANRGTPFALTVSNLVESGSATSLQFNLSPFGATNFVSLVQSRVQENGLIATGGSGVGYLLPTFRVDGAFDDAHPSASGTLAICAGLQSCPVTGLGVSGGGVQAVDQLYTPGIGASSQFTFDQPFSLFFFLSAGVSSGATGSLAAGGPVGGDFRLRLVGYRIVDATGVDIDGASLSSDLLNPVPEPGTALLSVVALTAFLRRRAARRREVMSA
jgi:hypothetical protein